VVEEPIAQRGPAAGLDRAPRLGTHRAPQRLVVEQVGHVALEAGEVAGGVEVSGAARLDEVERATCGDRHDRDAAGVRLLQGLAERLVLAGVHEHVERRARRGEGLAAQRPREVGAGQPGGQFGTSRPVADDDHGRVGKVAQPGQIIDLLLGRQPAHEADDPAAPRGDLGTPGVAAPGRVEQVGVHAASPQFERRHAHRVQQLPARPARHQAERGGFVNELDAPAQHRLHRGQAVLRRVARHVGLVDSDRRQVETLGGHQAAQPDVDRRGEVHDVGAKVAQCPLQRPAWGGRDAHLRVAGHRQGAERHDPRAGVPRRGLGRPRGHDERLVTAAGKMLGDLRDRVRDAVDLGQERLGDDRDPHGSSAVAAGERQDTRRGVLTQQRVNSCRTGRRIRGRCGPGRHW